MSQSSLVVSLKHFLVGGIGQASARLQLLAMEIADERERVIALAIAAIIAAFFVCLAAVFGALIIVASYWDTPQRMASITWIAFGALVVAIIAIGFFVIRLKAPSSLFSHSLGELEKDQKAAETLQ